jgi:hypothetical protein
MISPMRLELLASFLTFVLSLTAIAAPDLQVRPGPIDKKIGDSKESQTSSKENLELDSLQISPTPMISSLSKAPPMLPTQPISMTDLSAGFAQGQLDKDHERLEGGNFSVGRTVFQDEKSAWTYSAGLITPESKTYFYLDGGAKVLLENFIPFEPYYKMNIVGIYDSEDGLGNFIDYRRYFIGLFFGFENLLESHRQYKFELGAETGYSGTHALARLTFALPD